MKKALGMLFVLGLLASPALAQKVYIDYAHDFDFDEVETFTYVDTDESNSKDPLMADRIVRMIKQQLTEGGLKEVENGGDIYVTYHVTTKQGQVLNTSGFGYGGWGGGWGAWGGGMSSSTTTVSTYTEGTLIVDGYDGIEKKVVWRGTGTVTIKAKPEKQVRQIEKILLKLGDKWDKIHAGKGK